ncbi:EamA family transporter [Clostridium bowmanii]|uniref:EamA family transporter n=1 Tax=Clostridium bowmanii TaxID=132925 RepID=UPI001C0CAF7C|nr:EamA family transporter [Clostridium bowmanii]MBU3188802.1 EamA family transporter [Clostridium bowmanii]MCA1073385.1 EamA family transporter [Clostridium bowmanii]
MKRKDFILAILVVIVWGANFTVIKLGLGGVPPMLLVTLRYTLVAFPAVFFIKPPKMALKDILLYGFTVGVGQFGCLFYAMHIGMPAGLASIIVQLQAFISPLLGYLFLKEKFKTKQLVGFLIGALGLIVIGVASSTIGISSIPIGAILLTICAPIFWSISNIVAKTASKKSMEKDEQLDMLSLVVWGSLVPPIPTLILALLIDSPQTLINSISNLDMMSIFSVLYLAFGSTLFGYGFWSILISKYPINKISPLSLLVPITGLLTARIVLFEELSKLQWLGVSVIIIGLMVTNLDVKQILNTINKNKTKQIE